MILLDTHTVIWLAQSPELISRRAHTAITAARQDEGLAISDKTLWEIAMLTQYRRIDIRVPLREFLDAVEHNFVILPITGAIAEQSIRFSPRYPNDPADRIIGATALIHSVQLVTADAKIRASGEVPCIW